MKNPDDGWIVTANNASVYRDYPYFLTDDWSYGARSQRIVDLVKLATSGTAKMTADTMRSIQFDTWNENAAFLVPRITDAKVSGGDGRAPSNAASRRGTSRSPSDSAPAAYFNVFWKNLLLDTFGDEIPEDYLPDGGDRWFTVVRTLWDNPKDLVVGRRHDEGQGRDARRRRGARARRGDRRAQRAAGLGPVGLELGAAAHADACRTRRSASPASARSSGSSTADPIATAGGESIVDATGWTPTNGYAVDWVPSMRMVLDLSNLDDSTWVNLTGASGHAYNAHYVDQLDAWQSGSDVPVPVHRRRRSRPRRRTTWS